MFLKGIYWSPDSGAGDSAGDGAGDTPGQATEGGGGMFDPSTLVWPLKASPVYGAGWKVGDTLPALVVDLSDGAGTKPVLTGATVVFRMRPSYGGALTLTLTGTATPITDQTTYPGRVAYAFGAGDLSQDGQMLGEFAVTFPNGGGVATFPDSDYFTFNVLKSIV